MDKTLRFLDCETLYASIDCTFCGEQCTTEYPIDGTPQHPYTPRGWNDLSALGLSIGGAMDYTGKVTWFDARRLERFLRGCVETETRLVTFNGVQFDIPLLSVVAAEQHVSAGVLSEWLAMTEDPALHCDLLDMLWRVAPADKHRKGNSLGALSEANGLGPKFGDGAQAPRLWRQGQYAKVLKYCRQDMVLTQLLYEKVCRGEPLQRGGDLSPVPLPVPFSDAYLDLMAD